MLGFTNDSGGAYGLEALYNEQLTGKNGLVVTAQNASGTDLMNFFQDYYDAEDGSDLHLTLDANIQTLCESYLQKGIEEYGILNGGFIIAMDCNNGAILGMASSPNYDLNHYSDVMDSILNADIEEAVSAAQAAGGDVDEARSQAYSAALYQQWRNKALNETYEPGSTFKTLVLAAALEEGVTSLSDSFTCTGSVQVADYTIHCSNKYGHGTQDLATAVGHSCNPAFIALGQRLGTEKFYSYLEAFGIVNADGSKTSTGIDLPGEESSIVWSKDSFGITELATASFGQRLQVTPIQLITAINAVVNGGYLYTPHVVDYIQDSTGTTTYTADTTPVRQVISESTSATCREILEGVVANGLTGKNAYRAGYRIGGKTGTSETLKEGEYIVSFMGFAPADDPEVIVLVAFENPDNGGIKNNMYSSTGYFISGGQMAAPVAGDLLVDILDYRNYGKEYTVNDLTGVDTIVPNLVGQDAATAAATAQQYGFTSRTVGEGDTVTAQIPASGTSIPQGGELILYFGEARPESEVTMPDLTGCTPEEAAQRLNELGLYMRATGASQNYNATTKAYDQSVAAGTAVQPGTVVTVHFNDTAIAGDGVERESEIGTIDRPG